MEEYIFLTDIYWILVWLEVYFSLGEGEGFYKDGCLRIYFVRACSGLTEDRSQVSRRFQVNMLVAD